ncbi:MAG: argininosuccinate lyase, partial [Pedobacter sp.]
ENLFPAITSLNECLEMCNFMLQHISIKDDILKDPKYDYLFSVEVVNDLALQGIPFREAYKIVGEQIETGTFKPMYEVKHTHEGSIGNLMNEEIKAMMNDVLAQFKFEKVNKAIADLVK